MDATATSLCMDNDVPMIVFDLTKPGNIKAALQGEPVGTVDVYKRQRLFRHGRRRGPRSLLFPHADVLPSAF